MLDNLNWLYIGLATLFFIWFFRRRRDHFSLWSRLGVPGPEPNLLVGNVHQMLSKSLHEVVLEWVDKYGKVFGSYFGSVPTLNVVDNELCKQVMIKDFDCFINRQAPPTYHELFNQNLLFAEDEVWRRARTIISPSFTTGKLRSMAPLMHHCIDKLFAFLDTSIEKKSGVFEVRKVIAGFTMDVIASTGFATETDSNDDRASESKFLHHGLKFFRPVFLKMLLAFSLPRKVVDWLNIRTTNPQDALDYFINYTATIVKQRKATNLYRSDMIQLMIDAAVDEASLKNNDFDKLTASADKDETEEAPVNSNSVRKLKLTEGEIIANAIFLLAAGFETTSSALATCLYELALNPEAQVKLYNALREQLKEVDTNSPEFFEKVNFQIPYLEACIKEALRKYPPVPMTSRVLNKDHYVLAGVPLKRGQVVNLLVYGVHYNPEYFPEPEKFDPERFMPENKHLLKPYTYLPFSIGPRNCLGMRFAYQELRLVLARLILKYRFEPLPDTPQKLQFEKTFLLSTVPFELKIVHRD